MNHSRKILIASSICPDAIAQLEQNHDVRVAVNAAESELCSKITDRQVLVFRSGVQINRNVLASAPELELLIRAGSGMDNLDVEYASQREIPLIRIPEPGAQAVAELAFGMMLGLARQVRFHDTQLRQGNWTKQQGTGYVLKGKTLGIVGCGNIGSTLGRMGVAWGMDAVGCVDRSKSETEQDLKRQGIELATFGEVVERADFLSIHVPKTDATRNLINRSVLENMKPTSFLINMARGGVVDEQALLAALQSDWGPCGAGMDVHAAEGQGAISPLADLPNVILTPHVGATTVDTMREIGQRIRSILDSLVPPKDIFDTISAS